MNFLIESSEKAMLLLKEQPAVKKVKLEGNYIQCQYQGDDYAISHLLKVLVENEIPVIGLDKEVANLEDVFMKITALENEEETGRDD